MTADLEDLVFDMSTGVLSGGGQSAVISGSDIKRFHSSMSGMEFGNREIYGLSGAMTKDKRKELVYSRGKRANTCAGQQQTGDEDVLCLEICIHAYARWEHPIFWQEEVYKAEDCRAANVHGYMKGKANQYNSRCLCHCWYCVQHIHLLCIQV